MASPFGEGAQDMLKNIQLTEKTSFEWLDVLIGLDTYQIRGVDEPNLRWSNLLWRITLWNQLVYIFEQDFPLQRKPYMLDGQVVVPPQYCVSGESCLPWIFNRALLKSKVVPFLLRTDIWFKRNPELVWQGETLRKWDVYHVKMKKQGAIPKETGVWDVSHAKYDDVAEAKRQLIHKVLNHIRDILESDALASNWLSVLACYQLYQLLRRANPRIARQINENKLPQNVASESEIQRRQQWSALLEKQQSEIRVQKSKDTRRRKAAAAFKSQYRLFVRKS